MLDTIFVDYAAMAKTSITYLIEKGHRRIGMISGLENTPPHRNRIQGFCEAVSEHGLPVDDVLIHGGDFTEKVGYDGMQALLKTLPYPTAVFAANDLMALGAILTVREANL